MAPRRRPNKQRRRTNQLKLRLYFLRDVNEGTVFDACIRDFAAFPTGLAFRPLYIHWQIALSFSAGETDGNMLHRAAAAQIQVYGPIEQDSDHTIWSSAPILIPWGQRITGSRRISSPWFSAGAPNTSKILRVETLCLTKDTATVTTSWVVRVDFEFRSPDFSATCPTLSALLSGPSRPDDDDDDNTFSTSSSLVHVPTA